MTADPGQKDARDNNSWIVRNTVQAYFRAAPAAQQKQALLVTMMTALCETDLYNYSNPLVPASVPLGDRLPPPALAHSTLDSLGLFQQRTRWWGHGTEAERIVQLMTPETSCKLFLDELVNVKGWEALPPWQAAQAVQRSGTADGSNYQARLDQAQRVLSGSRTYFTDGGR